MDLRPAEVSAIIKQEIENYQDTMKMESVGTVLQVGDGVARVYGLDDCMVSEILEFPNGVFRIALNLEEDNVGAILLGSDTLIKEGDVVKTTGRIISVPVGESLVGRVTNALGQPIDGKGPIDESKFRPIEGKAPNVVQRQPVKEPIQTGLKSIDSMIPIGRGQRELIIGDRQTGKTALIVDTIINQKESEVYCIYVAVGQKNSTVTSVVRTLEEHGAMDYTTVISAPASDQASMQFIAPFTGCAMGEELRDAGKHVVIFYDDLYKHAMAWRQVSLLLRRPPGREAFPGDIFNLHSRLLERAAKLNDELGGGSLTALPVVETQEGDVSAYIPTNVISITDGQVYLEADLFNAGVRPGVNVGLSVSRVGGAAQIPAMKKVSGGLRINLAQYRELQAFAQFGSDLDKQTQAQLTRGERLVEILKQPQYAPMSVERQIMIIYCGTSGALDDMDVSRIADFEKGFLKFMDEKKPEVGLKIKEELKFTEEVEAALKSAIEEFRASFK